MKLTLSLAFLFLFVINALGQNVGKVSGRILQNGKPAEGATVALLRTGAAGPVKLSAADKDGAYVFDNLPEGEYRIGATAVGYQKAASKPVQVTAQQPAAVVSEISLTPAANDLGNVTVTAKRPLIEQRIDRTIVNVEASITNLGASALEVLEKAPGVSVDRDGNVTLKGKEGVLIMVDGRPTQLGGADLANLLRGLNSNQLDQIEIMTNPPARYDAAGATGIINIKTKKTSTAGLNGSVNTTYSQGRYPKTAEGFNLNYRNTKWNLFTNLGHNYQMRFSNMRLDRNLVNAGTGAVEQIFNQEADRVGKGHAYNAKLGVDFFATKKTTIGAAVNLNKRSLVSRNPNVTNISNVSKVLESVTRANVENESDWNSVSTNLNFRRLMGKKGAELTADVDFAQHGMENTLFMVNAYTDADGNAYTKADTLRGDLPQQITVYSGRADFSLPLKGGARFEAGVKSSIVRTDNNAVYDSVQYGQVRFDAARSNHFVYEETIHAAYANLNAPLSKKLTAQFGLRLENTVANGRQLTTGDNFDRNYTQLFPSAYFQYKANEKHNFGANIGRRVSRPNYQSLNPFIRFIDRYTFSQGNPALRPSVSNNIELTHTYKNRLTTTLNYTHVADIIQEIIQQKGQEAYNMPANVSLLRQVGAAVTLNTPVNNWWTSNVNLNAYRDRYKGTVAAAAINFAATSFIVNVTQQFKLTKTLSAELNGRYRNGWLEGVMRMRPIGFIGAGISQQVLKARGTLRLTARDILHSQRQKGITRYGNVDVTMRQFGDTQVLSLGFSYSFSKGKKIAPVKRTAGSADEEQNRIGQ